MRKANQTTTTLQRAREGKAPYERPTQGATRSAAKRGEKHTSSSGAPPKPQWGAERIRASEKPTADNPSRRSIARQEENTREEPTPKELCRREEAEANKGTDGRGKQQSKPVTPDRLDRDRMRRVPQRRISTTPVISWSSARRLLNGLLSYATRVATELQGRARETGCRPRGPRSEGRRTWSAEGPDAQHRARTTSHCAGFNPSHGIDQEQ